jgi:hypothetical protein
LGDLFQQPDTLGVVVLRGGVYGSLNLPPEVAAERPPGLQFVLPRDDIHVGDECVVRGVIEADRVVVAGDEGIGPCARLRGRREQAR